MWHKYKPKAKLKFWILDYSFYIFNGTFAYRSECSCRKDKKADENCPKCNGEGWIFMRGNGHINGGLYHVLNQCITRMREGYRIITMFDPPKEQLIRTQLLDSYKGNRAPTPDYITHQMNYGMKMLPLCDAIECYYSDHAESDDVMATIAIELAEEGHEVVVASDDKDMFPLLDWSNITLYRQKDFFTADDFRKKFNFEPRRFNEYLAICGDVADNFNLIKGLGPAAAESFINKYDNIIDVFDDIDNVVDKYKRKLVKSCNGSLCDRCAHNPAKEKLCANMGENQIEYLKDTMELSLQIATLDYRAEYKRIQSTPNREEFKAMLEELRLNQAINNIELFYRS